VQDYDATWPLTKVLDIGGTAVTPTFGDEDEPEAPPIPCHTHAGDVVEGKVVGPGKLEAYFFPPVDVPPYNLDLAGSVKTRLALKDGVSKQQVVDAVANDWGKTDQLYSLLQEYKVQPWTNWTIPTHVIHAPGPWPTFEIQLAADDYNLLAWQLGQPETDDATREDLKATHCLRGLADEEDLIEQTVKWERNVGAAEFEKKWLRDCAADPLESGTWGRRIPLFFHNFYGEGFEILPGQAYTRAATDQPYAGIVWSGKGSLNGQPLDVAELSAREFLVTPGHAAAFENTGADPLLIYSAWPIVSMTDNT